MDREFEELYAIKEYDRSPDGIAATVLGGVSAFLFVVLTAAGVMIRGGAGAWAGSLGITAFVLAFFGMIKGLHSFRDQCRSYTVSKVGTILSGVMVAIWFLTFCIGLSVGV